MNQAQEVRVTSEINKISHSFWTEHFPVNNEKTPRFYAFRKNGVHDDFSFFLLSDCTDSNSSECWLVAWRRAEL